MTSSTFTQWYNWLLYSCPVSSTPFLNAIGYALGLSVAFVGSLYVLVPRNIRLLDRDDDVHIQWRLAASTCVGIVAIFTYPSMLCTTGTDESSPSALASIGFTLQARPVIQVLSHTVVLYLGSNLATLLQIHELVLRQRRQGKSTSHFDVFKMLCIDSLFHPFWPQIRNLVAGPVLEELVFRACLVGPLIQSMSSRTRISWTAPLFFGVAHLHHAFLKWKDSKSLKYVLLSTTFQFAYTTLFGAYATHAFLRTNSLPAIIVSHQYCNYMGVPDLSFLKPTFGRLSIVYSYRWFLIGAYIVGIVGFVWGFDGILP